MSVRALTTRGRRGGRSEKGGPLGVAELWLGGGLVKKKRAKLKPASKGSNWRACQEEWAYPTVLGHESNDEEFYLKNKKTSYVKCRWPEWVSNVHCTNKTKHSSKKKLKL